MVKDLALVYGENPTPVQKYYLKNRDEINRKRREKYKQLKENEIKCVPIGRDIIETKLDQIESKLDQIESKQTQIESNQSQFETKLVQIESNIESKLTQIELNMNKLVYHYYNHSLRNKLESQI